MGADVQRPRTLFARKLCGGWSPSEEFCPLRGAPAGFTTSLRVRKRWQKACEKASFYITFYCADIALSLCRDPPYKKKGGFVILIYIILYISRIWLVVVLVILQLSSYYGIIIVTYTIHFGRVPFLPSFSLSILLRLSVSGELAILTSAILPPSSAFYTLYEKSVMQYRLKM